MCLGKLVGPPVHNAGALADCSLTLGDASDLNVHAGFAVLEALFAIKDQNLHPPVLGLVLLARHLIAL